MMILGDRMFRYLVTVLPLLAAGGDAARAIEPEMGLPFDPIHAHEAVEGHFHWGWESRYFSEGRDNLDGGSLWSTSLETGWRHLSGAVWLGWSPDRSYDEIQCSLAMTEEVGDFEFYAGLTHLRYPSGDEQDTEIGVGGSWAGGPLELMLSVDGYYAFDAGGAFWEAGLGRDLGLTDALTLRCGAVFGMNQGYVSDGHDGANHVSLRLGLDLAVTESLVIVAHAVYNWGLDRDPAVGGDGLLRDGFHGGAGLRWEF